METLEKVGAKINLNLEQLILPCLTSKDDKFHSIKILTPHHSTISLLEKCERVFNCHFIFKKQTDPNRRRTKARRTRVG